MNAQLKKIWVLLLALCIGFAALPGKSHAIGEAGTFHVTPEFGAYGTGQAGPAYATLAAGVWLHAMRFSRESTSVPK